METKTRINVDSSAAAAFLLKSILKIELFGTGADLRSVCLCCCCCHGVTGSGNYRILFGSGTKLTVESSKFLIRINSERLIIDLLTNLTHNADCVSSMYAKNRNMLINS